MPDDSRRPKISLCHHGQAAECHRNYGSVLRSHPPAGLAQVRHIAAMALETNEADRRAGALALLPR
jgi:hypothetical protein